MLSFLSLSRLKDEQNEGKERLSGWSMCTIRQIEDMERQGRRNKKEEKVLSVVYIPVAYFEYRSFLSLSLTLDTPSCSRTEYRTRHGQFQ